MSIERNPDPPDPEQYCTDCMRYLSPGETVHVCGENMLCEECWDYLTENNPQDTNGYEEETL